jgi:hypothetical protein
MVEGFAGISPNWDCPLNARARAGRRGDLQRASDGADAIPHADHPLAVTVARTIPSDTVIGDCEMDAPAITPDRDRGDGVVAGVLDDILDGPPPCRSRSLPRRVANNDRCRRCSAAPADGCLRALAMRTPIRIDAIGVDAQEAVEELRMLSQQVPVRGAASPESPSAAAARRHGDLAPIGCARGPQ